MNSLGGVMVLGTATDVGKSYVTAALCRLFANEGVKVTPFKPINITKNTVEIDGGVKIGMSVYFEAVAARVKPTIEMNPILYNYGADKTEITFLGEELGNRPFYEHGIATINKSLAHLNNHYDAVVIEGAGSPVELNIREKELTNFTVANLADVPVILVANVDKGGIFAALKGTVELMTAEERNRVCAIVVNRFRGNPKSFEDGKEIIEDIVGIPVIGIIPYEEKRAGKEQIDLNEKFDAQAEHVKKYIDWEKLKKIINGWT